MINKQFWINARNQINEIAFGLQVALDVYKVKKRQVSKDMKIAMEELFGNLLSLVDAYDRLKPPKEITKDFNTSLLCIGYRFLHEYKEFSRLYLGSCDGNDIMLMSYELFANLKETSDNKFTKRTMKEWKRIINAGVAAYKDIMNTRKKKITKEDILRYYSVKDS